MNTNVYTVTVKGTEVTFTSAFATLTEALDVLRARGRGDFARDLCNARALSSRQAAWAHKLATELVTPRAEQPASQHQLPEVRNLLLTARAAGKRFPKITLDLDGRKLVLSLTGAGSKTPNCVRITDGAAYPETTWFGSIDTEGNFRGSRQCTPELLDLLTRLNADPASVAGQHGLASGWCCFCKAALTADGSLAVGYGPVCAQKFGLPWGVKV